MIISKEKLIQEITEQLEALAIIWDNNAPLTISDTLTLLDLQFRLKSKLYELTQKEGAEENE